MPNALLRILRLFFLGPLRALLIPAAILAVAASAGGRIEKTGDRLQVGLPVLAWGCAAANGRGIEYLGRYLVMFAAAHGTKQALGDLPLNRRPRGGAGGMPSAHSSTAALGASRLVSDCLTGAPAAQATAILAAGFVGGSRLVVGAHDIWQVMAGMMLGLICDRAGARAFARLRRILRRG